jgi:hypothetical protein
MFTCVYSYVLVITQAYVHRSLVFTQHRHWGGLGPLPLRSPSPLSPHSATAPLRPTAPHCATAPLWSPSPLSPHSHTEHTATRNITSQVCALAVMWLGQAKTATTCKAQEVCSHCRPSHRHTQHSITPHHSQLMLQMLRQHWWRPWEYVCACRCRQMRETVRRRRW